jgi:hypothetical protein
MRHMAAVSGTRGGLSDSGPLGETGTTFERERNSIPESESQRSGGDGAQPE